MTTGDGMKGAAGSYASPPCYMHELDPDFAGHPIDHVQANDVARWRKAERQRLIAARLALNSDAREAHAGLIARDLDDIVRNTVNPIVSLYWPFRGEPDLRPWMTALHGQGVRVALPVVVAKGQPLIFRQWQPGAPLARGVWNIPFPADGVVVAPTIVIAPLVGFDQAGFRLGYGGGFFDRTLAARDPKPIAIGVGHPIGAVPTIFPQPHDIPMDWIVTGLAPPRSYPRSIQTAGDDEQ
ncbi:MAG: 5-formyltetrahydrofolate cyclo-ligase [Hyphomicrobium sp.]